jgi:hypothetical protein
MPESVTGNRNYVEMEAQLFQFSLITAIDRFDLAGHFLSRRSKDPGLEFLDQCRHTANVIRVMVGNQDRAKHQALSFKFFTDRLGVARVNDDRTAGLARRANQPYVVV